MEEMQDALHRAHDTAAGLDEMHYQLLKYLPSSLDKIWISGDFLSYWRKAIVIPIPKPGKDPTNPVALTMCSVASDPDVAQLIILLQLKRFVGKLSSIINT